MALSLTVDAVLDAPEHEAALFEPASRPKHRRSRSDPTDWLRSMRGSAPSPTDERILAGTAPRLPPPTPAPPTRGARAPHARCPRPLGDPRRGTG